MNREQEVSVSELVIGNSGGEGGILRAPDKHRAILRFFNEFQLGCAVFPSKMAHSTIRILPEMVAKW
jgi:hypothetical protein